MFLDRLGSVHRILFTPARPQRHALGNKLQDVVALAPNNNVVRGDPFPVAIPQTLRRSITLRRLDGWVVAPRGRQLYYSRKSG
ncbi:hypothetical protein [Dokdonella sp.]|uniref:hypothetical protein n=1 Tax=Dokdonella sp. TaxID=2291710 RepID=UPI0025B8B402|nr:hypothetical protein [Dokdonella sp.]